MIIPLKDRQGFQTGLSGVAGTSIQSAFTKPILEPTRAAANLSWLPYPYGPLPDVGPWAKNGYENEKQEQPVPETPSELQPWKAKGDSATMLSGGFLLVVVVACAWFLVKYIPGGYK